MRRFNLASCLLGCHAVKHPVLHVVDNTINLIERQGVDFQFGVIALLGPSWVLGIPKAGTKSETAMWGKRLHDPDHLGGPQGENEIKKDLYRPYSVGGHMWAN